MRKRPSDPIERARHHRLWIDDVRREIVERYAAIKMPLEEVLEVLDFGMRCEALADFQNWTVPMRLTLAENEPLLRAMIQQHGLADRPLWECALRTLGEHGATTRSIPVVDAALGCTHYFSLLSHDAQMMMLDDRLAEAIILSNNEPITAAELQYVPWPHTLIEFHRPVEICPHVKMGVRARAVSMLHRSCDIGSAAMLIWHLDYWESLTKAKLATAEAVGRYPSSISVWFGAGVRRPTFDPAPMRALGVSLGTRLCEEIIEAAEVAARNIWDFVTSRSLRYEVVHRKHAKLPMTPQPKHTQGQRAPATDREVFILSVSRDAKKSDEPYGNKEGSKWGYRVSIPGAFHQWVYCAACGDTHRADLLGSPCRKCGQVVGPRANLRIEKYWHAPYIAGPANAPIKEVVREVRRKKKK